MQQYDAIIIGGGHNGLVTAALLADTGRSVLVLEQRETLGGAAATEEIFPGFKINSGAHDAGLFRPEIVEALALADHGLEFTDSPAVACAPQPDGRALTLWRDVERSQAEIARFSEADADKFPAFIEAVGYAARFLQGVMLRTPPSLSNEALPYLLSWFQSALEMERVGQRELSDFFRVLALSVAEWLDEWFESDALKGLLGTAGIAGAMQGPLAPYTAFVFLYHYLGGHETGFRSSRFVQGGVGQLSAALAAAARTRGVDIQTGIKVAQVLIDNGEAGGVLLENGDKLGAKVVISNADPRRTFFSLVGPTHLPLNFVRRVKNIRFRGVTAKVNLALSALPNFIALSQSPNPPISQSPLSGHILISPSLEYLERAYDDAKYGRFSAKPYLDVVIPTLTDPSLAPDEQHVMSITMQYAPYRLREGDWETQRETLGDHIIDTLAAYAPNLKELILQRQVLTPLDWEQEYGLTEGSIYHGQMEFDQWLSLRPVAGFGHYRTPIRNLYLCGAGTHPGGGLTGVPGYNAAQEILSDFKDWLI